jgi:hypothetical protein
VLPSSGFVVMVVALLRASQALCVLSLNLLYSRATDNTCRHSGPLRKRLRTKARLAECPLGSPLHTFEGARVHRMSQGDLVVVQSYGTEGEAEVAKGILESSGIDAMSNSGRGALTLLCAKFNRPFTTGLRERTLHSSRDEGRAVDRRSRLLAPGFSKAARVHRIEPISSTSWNTMALALGSSPATGIATRPVVSAGRPKFCK